MHLFLSIFLPRNVKSLFRLCDSRKYTYFFPSYLLIPPKPGSGLFQNLLKCSNDSINSPFWGPDSAQATLSEDLERKRKWRVSTEQVEQLRAAVKRFEGTHNFHNFTLGRDFKDRSNQRNMKSIEVCDRLSLHANSCYMYIFR